MAKQITYTLNEKHTWASNTTTSISLPEDGYITHLDCIVKAYVTVGGTAAVKEDPFHRLVKSMRIKASGKTYADFSDGRQWKFYSYPQYRGQLYEDVIPGSLTAAAYYRCHMPLHLGVNPSDKYDPSVVIPGVKLQDLKMEVSWGATTDIGADHATAFAAEMQIQVYQLNLAPSESEADIWPNGLLSPRIEPVIYSSMAAYSNLGFSHNLPVGDTLYRVSILSLDSSDVRTDTNVTALGFKLPKYRETPIDRAWYHQLYHDRVLHDFHQPISDGYGKVVLGSGNGVAFFYGSEISGRDMGLDLTRAVTGDAQINATIGTSGGAMHFLHVMYQ